MKLIMKSTHYPQCRADQGSVLLVVMGTIVVIGIALAAILSLTTHEQRILARTTAWNAALPVAEAGIEEAMSHLQKVGIGARGVNGWQASESGKSYVLSRDLSNGRYVVGISSDTPPVVLSVGHVWCPSAGRFIERAVQITTSNTPLFTVAFGARYVVDLNGNGISTDSFDSSNPNLSTDGRYDPSKTSTNGDVASVFGPVDIGNHTIKGDLYLGPTAEFASSKDKVTGTVYGDFNLDFPDVVPPENFTGWPHAIGLPTIIGGITYKYVFLTDGEFTIPDSGSIYVGPGTNVKLRVTASSFDPSEIRIAGPASTAGKLTVYMEGAGCTMAGNSVVESGNAANFTYYGLPSNTSITYSGTSSFVGTIYAPSAVLTMNGGGNNNGLIGSSITKTIRMNGHYNFHFDENLLKAGPSRGFTMTSWQEI